MINLSNLPSNSHKSRVTKKQKIVKGRVRKQKKTFMKQIVETFIGEEVDSVGDYILHDVVIPAIKNTLSDAIQGGIEMLLFGDRDSSRRRRNGGNKPNISYSDYSKPNRRHQRAGGHRGRSMSDIVLDTRNDAQEVLNSLVDIIDEYGQATVSDLNDLLGVSGKYTDNDYGWENLNAARISSVRGGYLLDMPKPIYLN